ncbi:membrane protein [Beggiatoa sp. PS]|nr:membrane protein [Beggiatoa sp. PS]
MDIVHGFGPVISLTTMFALMPNIALKYVGTSQEINALQILFLKEIAFVNNFYFKTRILFIALSLIATRGIQNLFWIIIAMQSFHVQKE